MSSPFFAECPFCCLFQLPLITPVLPLLRHILADMKDGEALADGLWALDGIAGQARGAGLIAEDRGLLRSVLHILAHCTQVCCCRCYDQFPAAVATSSSSESNTSSTHAPELSSRETRYGASDNCARRTDGEGWGEVPGVRQPCGDPFGTRKSPCCRVCNSGTDGRNRKVRSDSGEGRSVRTQGRGERQADESIPSSYQLCVRPALRIVGQIATGSVQQTQRLLDCCKRNKPGEINGGEETEYRGQQLCNRITEEDFLLGDLGHAGLVKGEGHGAEKQHDESPLLLDVLRVLIRHERKAIRKDCGWCLSNMAVGSLGQLLDLIHSDLISIVLSRLLPTPGTHREEEEDVRRELLWVIINASTTASDRSLTIDLIRQGIIHPICEMMRITATAGGDLKAAMATVDAAFNIFEQIRSTASAPKNPLGTTSHSHAESENRDHRSHNQERPADMRRALFPGEKKGRSGDIRWGAEPSFETDSSHADAALDKKQQARASRASRSLSEELQSTTFPHCCSCSSSERRGRDENQQNGHLSSWSPLCPCACHHILLLTTSLFLEQDFPYFLHLVLQQVQLKTPSEVSSIPQAFFCRTQYLLDHLLQMKTVFEHHQQEFLRQILEQYHQYCEANLIRVQQTLSSPSERGSHELPRILVDHLGSSAPQRTQGRNEWRGERQPDRVFNTLETSGNGTLNGSPNSFLPVKRPDEEIAMEDSREWNPETDVINGE